MKHKLLIIGVGSIGERHTRCFTATGRAEIRIAENNAELRATVAQRYGLAATYESLEAGLSDSSWRPDAVLIAAPTHLHIAMARQVIKHGTHVLIEKALSTSEAGVAELIAEVAASKKIAAVLYTYRAHPLIRSMRAAIEEGRYGRPVQVVSTWGQHFPFYRPAYRTIYYTKRETGGGAIQDVLTHSINAGEFLVGPIEKLQADCAHQVLEGTTVEDTVHVITRHRGNTGGNAGGDVMGCYSLNQHQTPNENSITVICERGTIRFELHNSRWLSMDKPGGEWKVEETFSMERDDIFIAQAHYYCDVLEGKASPLCTLAEGLQTLKVNLAILDAADHPKWHGI